MNNADLKDSSLLSIAVVGAGSIGSAFAYQLAKAGHDVTVIARPASLRLQQVQRDGGIVLKTGEKAETRVAGKIEGQTAYDLVIVTTLAHQVDGLMPELQHSKARAIHFMFNVFDPERLQALIGSDRCSFGMPFVMAALGNDGKLGLTISPSRKTLHGDERWVKLFADTRIPSAFEPDMLLWLRCHVPLCIAMESVSVRARQRGGGASWSDAVAVARGLHGGFTIIESLGYRLYPREKTRLKNAPTFVIACFLWFVSRIPSFRDLLATGKRECCELIDVMVLAASKAPFPLDASAKSLTEIRPAD